MDKVIVKRISPFRRSFKVDKYGAPYLSTIIVKKRCYTENNLQGKTNSRVLLRVMDLNDLCPGYSYTVE